MATKPVLFKPKLTHPEGINNYTGEAFRCFTVGDTLPFEFTISSADDPDIDVTGWSIVIAIALEFDSLIANGIEVVIPLVDISGKVFKGDISNILTKTLTPGINRAIAKYINVGGEEFIFDMCLLEVYKNIEFTLD